MKFFSLFKSKKEPILAPLKELTFDELEKIKFQARIAFVDDEEIPHVNRLREDGYNITQYEDIENIDDFLRKKYHLIIIDIQGVGQNISPKSEGWGILKYLKKAAPNLIVIMFTGAEWSITKYKDEANVADDFIGKDLEFLDFKSKLDNGIKKAFSPKYHFEIEKSRILKEISNTQTVEQIKLIVEKYGSDKTTALTEIKKITQNKNVIESMDGFFSIINHIKSLVSPI